MSTNFPEDKRLYNRQTDAGRINSFAVEDGGFIKEQGCETDGQVSGDRQIFDQLVARPASERRFLGFRRICGFRLGASSQALGPDQDWLSVVTLNKLYDLLTCGRSCPFTVFRVIPLHSHKARSPKQPRASRKSASQVQPAFCTALFVKLSLTFSPAFPCLEFVRRNRLAVALTRPQPAPTLDKYEEKYRPRRPRALTPQPIRLRARR